MGTYPWHLCNPRTRISPTLVRLHSIALVGIEARACEIGVDVTGRGFGVTTIVGLPDSAVKESVDRIRSALSNSGFAAPRTRSTINLAPADVKKEGRRSTCRLRCACCWRTTNSAATSPTNT